MGLLAFFAAFSILPALGQDQTLSILEAVRLARERNGDIRAAFLDVEAARSETREARASFFPTLTGRAGYTVNRSEVFTGPFRGRSSDSNPIADISFSWLLLDSGERQWSYEATRLFEEATVASSLQTLRNILFTVYQQYYDTLRSQELVVVSSAQVNRAAEIEKQTQAQIDVGAAAKKDILQVRADRLNAEVDRLTAENSNSIAEANLKATIGLDTVQDLPPLEKPVEPAEFEAPAPLDEVVREGLANRPDLIALRKRRDAQILFVRLANRRAGITWNLDATYDRSFAPGVDDFAAATFLASYPIFDGHRLREQHRQERIQLETQNALITQAEREARAAIESAHALLRQDVQRINAAKSAVEAARLNYQAALESQRLGAEGTDIITVLTAQVSLVNAELNYIEALYDYFISDVRLKLVTGRPIPGERA